MATLEQLSAALIKADAAGNTADAKAFADEIRRMRTATSTPAAPAVPAAPLTGPDAIPVEPGANTTITPDQPQGVLGKYAGMMKVAPALASGAVAGVVAPVAGLAHGLFAGKYGTPQGVRDADAFAGRVSNALTYQPNNPLTDEIVGKVGKVMQNVIGVPIPTMNALGQSAPAGMRAVKDATRATVTPVTDLVTVPLAIRAAEKQAVRAAQSQAIAPQIDAVKRAVELNLMVDPAVSNPTKGNRVLGAVSNEGKTQQAMAKHNEVRIQELAREEMGLPAGTRLDSSEAFDAARKIVSKPYDDIAAMPALVAPDEVIGKVRSLRVKPTIDGEAAAGAANNVIDKTVKAIASGEFKGSDAITNIRQFRDEAHTILNSKKTGHPITPEMQATADVKLGVADALESLVEANLKDNPALLQQFRDARVKMAKTYAYENATDFNSSKIDTGKLAEATAKDSRLTGVIADIGNIAGNFPETFVKPSTKGGAIAHASRWTPAGILGMVAGAPLGPYGAMAGSVVGATAGEIAGRVLAKKMSTPGYQARNAIPKDYRPPANNLRPVEPNVTTNSLVPFDYSRSIEQPGSRQNWTYGRPDPHATFMGPNPDVAPIPVWQDVDGRNTYSPNYKPQLGAPSAESTLQGVQQRRAFDYNMQKTLEEQQAAAQAAQQRATRKPTSGEVILEFDPITKKYIPSNQIQPASAANIQIIEGTGKSGVSAAEKVVGKRLFDMTATEKVAWSKSLLDGMPVAEGEMVFGKLTPQQIAGKMADRQWVADTVTKAQQKAAAFDDIAKRANSAQAAREAVASRDRLLDFVESLQEKLSAPRPTRSGVQGKKTREAQRTNNLGTAADNVNSLIIP